MKKFLIIFLSILFISISIPSVFAQTCKDEPFYVADSSTVNLFMEKEDGMFGSCTGVVVSKNEETTGILTANHCVLDTVNIHIDMKYPVTKIISSKLVDLAYVEIKTPDLFKMPAELATRNVRNHEMVYVLGDYYLYRLYTCGYITAVGHSRSYAELGIKPGCSGGGVFNKHNELVGIMTVGWFSDEDYKISTTMGFVNIKPINKFLSNIN